MALDVSIAKGKRRSRSLRFLGYVALGVAVSLGIFCLFVALGPLTPVAAFISVVGASALSLLPAGLAGYVSATTFGVVICFDAAIIVGGISGLLGGLVFPKIFAGLKGLFSSSATGAVSKPAPIADSVKPNTIRRDSASPSTPISPADAAAAKAFMARPPYAQSIQGETPPVISYDFISGQHTGLGFGGSGAASSVAGHSIFSSTLNYGSATQVAVNQGFDAPSM